MKRGWTIQEDELLVEKYAEASIADLLALFPGRTLSAVYARSHLLRLKRSDEYFQRLADSMRKHPKPAAQLAPAQPVSADAGSGAGKE